MMSDVPEIEWICTICGETETAYADDPPYCCGEAMVELEDQNEIWK